MRVRCLYCHEPFDVPGDSDLSRLTCSTCGGSFSLVVDHDRTVTYVQQTRTLGHFELFEQVGTGAFGAVWKARDKELDRVVAIKIPRKDQLDAQETEQFLREARAAAQLKHPHIVGVHEVGRDGETVYIVSDFVQGATLDDWLTGQRLTAREAAELSAKVAGALHHAHEQGVIHRDLKPGNIMIDVDGQPHLMDFGLARRQRGEVSVTMEGRILGTPAYMSPEQARGEAHTADRRTDIYSLGVLLFRLLTGELPFRGNAQMLLVQILREEPPSPRKLNNRVPHDLETITLKCLAKEPGRRYATAAELAGDLRRWLDGEPILARPAGVWERGWKWAKRRPALAASLGVSILAGVSVLAGALWHNAQLQALVVEIGEAKDDALRQRDQAVTQRALARKAVDEMYTEVAEKWLEDQPGLQETQKQFLQKALRYYEGFAKEESTDPTLEYERARAYMRVGRIQVAMGQTKEAEDAFANALPLLEKLARASPDSPECRHDLAESRYWLAIIFEMTGRSQEARQASRHALESSERLLRDFPSRPDFRYLLARCSYLVGFAGSEGPEESIRHYRQTVILADQLIAEHPTVAEYSVVALSGRWGLAGRLRDKGQNQEAEDILNKAVKIGEKVEADHPNVSLNKQFLSLNYTGLADLLAATARLREAEKAQRRGVDLAKKLVAEYPTLAQPHWYLAVALRGLGLILTELGSYQEAEQAFREAFPQYEKLTTDYPKFAGYFGQFAECRNSLGKLLSETGRSTQAVDEYRRAIAILERANEFINDAKAHKDLSWYLSMCPLPELRNPARAVALAKKALAEMPEISYGWDALALAHYRAGDWKAALSAIEKSMELSKGGECGDWLIQAMTYWQLGDKPKAREWYHKADQWMHKNRSSDLDLLQLRAEAASLLGIAEAKK